MKSINIKELTDEELSDLINEEALNYTKMRLSHTITPLENPARLVNTRKKIARLKTEVRARQLAKK